MTRKAHFHVNLPDHKQKLNDLEVTLDHPAADATVGSSVVVDGSVTEEAMVEAVICGMMPMLTLSQGPVDANLTFSFTFNAVPPGRYMVQVTANAQGTTVSVGVNITVS